MNVGLPGTGLGGLFYIVNGIVMVSIEGLRFVFGRTNFEKRRIAKRQMVVLLGMVAAVLVVDWLLGLLLVLLAGHTRFGAGGSEGSEIGIAVFAFAPLLISLAILLGVMLATLGLGFFFDRTTKVP